MFEQATRLKLRLNSSRGLLSVEDLWDLPLTSTKGQPNLDDIARELHRELRAQAETVSFVTPPETTVAQTVQLGFDVVKHIIDIRVAERDAKAQETKRREAKQKILEVIARKQDESLGTKSIEELKAMAEAL